MTSSRNPKRHAAQPPVVLHITIGIEYLISVLDTRGVAGWNGWRRSMRLIECNPLRSAWVGDDPISVLQVTLNFRGCDFSSRNLDGIDLSEMNLRKAVFRGASLRGADFSSCTLSGASFAGADLRAANFQGAFLDSTDFTDASAERTRFENTSYDPETPPRGLPTGLAASLHRSGDGARDSGWQLVSMIDVEVPTVAIPATAQIAYHPFAEI